MGRDNGQWTMDNGHWVLGIGHRSLSIGHWHRWSIGDNECPIFNAHYSNAHYSMPNNAQCPMPFIQ